MKTENKILIKYLIIALCLVLLAYLSGIEIINGLTSIFDLFLMGALIYTGIKKDSLNKKYYYFLFIYLLLLGLLQIGQLGVIWGTLFLIAPHIWFVLKRPQTVSPQIARSYYFIISPIVILILFYALSFTEIFTMYGLSPITWISRLI